MLQRFKDHPWTTVCGILGAALGSFATVANADKLTGTQMALAFAGCLWAAVQGVLSADAKPGG